MNKLNVVLVAVILASGCSVGIPAPTPEPTVSRQVRAEDAGRFIDAGQNDSGVTVDAGVDCAVGTESCSCTEWGGCAPGLECGVEDICNHSPEDRDAGIEVPDVVSPEPSPEEDAGWIVVDGGAGEVDCSFANPCEPEEVDAGEWVDPYPPPVVRCGAVDCAALYSRPAKNVTDNTRPSDINWSLAVPACYLDTLNETSSWRKNGEETGTRKPYGRCFDDGSCWRSADERNAIWVVAKRDISLMVQPVYGLWTNPCTGLAQAVGRTHCVEDSPTYECWDSDDNGASLDTVTSALPTCAIEMFTDDVEELVWPAPYDCAN